VRWGVFCFLCLSPFRPYDGGRARPPSHHHHHHHLTTLYPLSLTNSAWTLAARTCLAVAFAGWVSIVAGYANHQELLFTTASLDAPSSKAALLDRISSWALLHDADYFAKYASTLDPRDPRAFNKFWWLAAVEAAGLLIGAVGTLWQPPGRGTSLRFPTARILASAVLAMGQAPDGPETAVETVYNYRALGVRLPSYRVAIVIGASLTPLANLAAAMVLGWDPTLPAGPDVTRVAVPDPRVRGVPAWQAWLERTYLGAIDKVRRPGLVGLAAAQWACMAVGCAGYGLGIASGKWWRTHIPLCGTALAAQLVANLALAAALTRRTQGRADGTAQAAQGCALLLSIWRINRSWAAGVTLVAVRTGVQPPVSWVCMVFRGRMGSGGEMREGPFFALSDSPFTPLNHPPTYKKKK
jgi:hypothetical protein